MNTKEKKSFDQIAEKLNVLWIWAALVFMITIFEPLSIYFTERIEFWFDFYTLFPCCLLMFAVIFATGAAVIGILIVLLGRFPRLRAVISGGVFGVFAALYLQGNFMTKDLPVISGGAVDWSVYGRQTVQSYILWSICLVIGIGLAYLLDVKKMQAKVFRYIGVFGILFFAMTVTMLGIRNNGFERNTLQVSTTKDLWKYSRTENMVILVIDTIDGDVEERALRNLPEFEETYKDFTDYTNVLSAYPYTQWALPFLVSGRWYEYDGDFEEYVGESYTQNALVDRLTDEGFTLDLYTNESPYRTCDMSMYENIMEETGKVKSKVDFCKLWLRLVGFKYAPYSLKRYSQIFAWEFDETGENTTEYPMMQFYESNIRFYEDIADETIDKSLTEDKKFKLIHLEGAHLPMWYRADLTFDYGIVTTYYENVVASNNLVSAYIEELKRLGVYDNTILVITADHGFNEVEGDYYYGRQHPMLFIKGLNERHDAMIRNDAPISHEDFGEMYQKLLDGAASTDVFPYHEGDTRTRRYLWCNDSDATGFVEAFTSDHAREDDSVIDSGVRYP
ncbi:MAG: sulfatase-like hydrolase/transferase [Lachnospiraceae bacterium]|nr:sulfatase-like hydrolase/transferase [Lachnospiraceae bacterium]